MPPTAAVDDATVGWSEHRGTRDTTTDRRSAALRERIPTPPDGVEPRVRGHRSRSWLRSSEPLHTIVGRPAQRASRRPAGPAGWLRSERGHVPRSTAYRGERCPARGLGALRASGDDRPAQRTGAPVPRVRRGLGGLRADRDAVRRGVHRARSRLHRRAVLDALGRRDAGARSRSHPRGHDRRPVPHRQGERHRRALLDRDRRRRVHRSSRLHHRRQPRLRRRRRCPSASSSRPPRPVQHRRGLVARSRHGRAPGVDDRGARGRRRRLGGHRRAAVVQRRGRQSRPGRSGSTRTAPGRGLSARATDSSEARPSTGWS